MPSKLRITWLLVYDVYFRFSVFWGHWNCGHLRSIITVGKMAAILDV